MAISLSNLVNNLSEGIHQVKCKYGLDDKKYETCGIKYKDCECCLKYINVKNNSIEYKCLCCNKNYQKTFDKNVKKRFANTYKFPNHDIKKFILLLQKGVYPYEQMDDWEKSNETSLPERYYFYSHLNMSDITDADYTHAKIVCKHLGEYCDLYIQSDTLLLADVFENFQNACLEIYELDPARFLTTPRLAW